MSSELKKSIKFPILEAETYNNIYDTALTYALSRVKQPVFNPETAEESDYPQSFTRPVNILLIIVAIVGFFISAGKQALAIYLIMQPVASSLGGVLGVVWVVVAVLGGIVLSEAGSLLFQIVSTPLSRGKKGIKITFYIYAALCVILALLGNVVVTSQHQFDSPLTNAYLWFFTIFNPILVIGVGTVYERQFMIRIFNHATARKQHREATEVYNAAVSNPEQLPDFKQMFVSGLIDAVKQASPRWVGGLLKADPSSQNWLVALEYRAQRNRSTIDLNADYPEQLPPVSSVTSKGNETSTDHNLDSVTPPIRAIQEPVLVNGSLFPMKRDENSLQVVTSQLERALALLDSDPNHYSNTSLRKLTDETGISIATWSRAIKRYKEQV